MDQTSVISLDTIKFLTSDGLKLFTNNILSIIEDNEYVTATAITDLHDRLLIVENNNSGSIITEADITAWGFTKNTGTITGVSANGTSVSTSGVANIPAASTSAYGVTKLSDATNSTSTTLAATANAVKQAYDLANGKGTYSKPSTGIPKSDLASAVQTSLGKADTALQSYTEQYTGTITGVSANGTSVATSGVANIPAATTGKYGVTKLSSSTSSTSTALAATASAVKAAYDLANTYKGTVTSITINGTTKNQTNGVIDLGTIPTEDSINNILTIIEDNEYVTATAITDLNERITNLELNGGGGSSDANIQAVDTGDVIDDVTVNYATTAYVDGLVGDINSILESIINGVGSISLITFTINGTQYQAEEGMTWGEWVNSEYSNGQYISEGGFISPVNSTMNGIYYMGGFESPTHIIRPLADYELVAL